MKTILFSTALVASLVLMPTGEAVAQLIPQPWVSVGSRNSETTFSVGARALNFGVELGRGTEDSTGVDALAFVNLPLIDQVSPYVGLGVYSEDQGVAVSGGVQLNPTDRLILGAGYHSIRGVNGQVGFRF
jgi:opacity protein-like surface antigen